MSCAANTAVIFAAGVLCGVITACGIVAALSSLL